jgi:hypothetical protein
MYEAHPIFVQPNSEDVRVWRYMDFTKFVSFIESQCLYFTRADKLDDPFEGSLPIKTVESRNRVNRRVLRHPDFPKGFIDTYLNQIATTGEINKCWRKFYAINCWHMNEHESAAMWKLYLKSNEGIAVQSIYRDLRESIIDDEKVYIGMVKYIDYEKESISHYYDTPSVNDCIFNGFSPFVHKRKSFEHEQEVRALIEKPPTTSEEKIGYYQDTIAHGIKVRVNVERLVEKIYIAPSAPNWLSDLVKSIAKKYGFKFEIVQSKLNESPVF